MPDAPDPPRKIYGFKKAEFESLNPPPAPAEIIDAAAMAREAASLAPILGNNAPVNRPNEVHATLQQNLAAANAAGLNEVHIDPNYRSTHQRRVRRFWLFVVFFDVPVGAYAWWIGHGAAIPFTLAIAAVGYFTGRLAWQTFFLNTD